MQRVIVGKYVIREKVTGRFAKCIYDDYCCHTIVLVENIEYATIHEGSFGTGGLDEFLSHSIDDESFRRGFEEIPVQITYSYDIEPVH